MPLTLSLSSADLDDDALHELTRQLRRDIGDEAGVEASLAAEPVQRGVKGLDPVLGQIIIAAIGSGGLAIALVNVFKAYVQRGKGLKIKLQKAGGEKLELDARNLGSEQFDKIVETFLKDVQ